MRRRFGHIFVNRVRGTVSRLSGLSADAVFRLVLISFFLIVSVRSVEAEKRWWLSGGVEHESLFPTKDAASLRSVQRAKWAKTDHLSNSYLDLSLHYVNNTNMVGFRELRIDMRGELMQWPLPGYEADFRGYGLGHLSVDAAFDWGEVSAGDVYGQFGSGLILNLYEDRSMGIDNSLRGAKIQYMPYRGIRLTALGGKQRRYWDCYTDGAWGWNYGRDAAMGADVEMNVEEWSRGLRERDISLSFGGSYVTRYQVDDTIMTVIDGGLYRYRLPGWVGAGEVRAEWQMKGWNVLLEYAMKGNDPTYENGFSYRNGNAWLASAGYSRKGLAVLAQVRRSDNMAFRSRRECVGIAGRLNHMPAFAQQHTYALPSLYAYATQYSGGEWAFQGEVIYSFARKTAMGGKYGTTLKLNGSHIRGARGEGEYYTDVNVELEKRLSRRWTLNAMLMYQGFNMKVVEGKGGMVRSGIAVLDAQVHISNNVSVRGELQYLYTRDDMGQWCFALCELSLYKEWTVSGEWMYNIGGTTEAEKEHFYTAALTYTHDAHRVMAGYTKTLEGYNCSGGVCRFVPRQEGVKISYNYTW